MLTTQRYRRHQSPPRLGFVGQFEYAPRRQICAAPCRVTLSMHFWRREGFAEFRANSFTKNYFDAT